MKKNLATFILLLGLGCFGCGATTDEGSSAATATDAGAARSLDGAVRTSTDASADASAEKKEDPSCSSAAEEGDPCSVKGSFCRPSGACTDECSFCNVLECNGGKWERLEAPPMPPSYCADVQCGAEVCGKGQTCVRTHSGPMPLDGGSGIASKCVKLPSGCTDCTCAKAAVSCNGMMQQCTPEPTSNKPIVDCYGI